MVGPVDVKQKWFNWMPRWLGYLKIDLWPWIFKVKLYLWNGTSNVKYGICYVKSGICYISAKNALFATKKTQHICWNLGLKWDHQVWLWPWPWPWLLKVKYGICYISAKNGPIDTNRKTNISIELWASNVTIRFDHGHDIDLEFSGSNMEFAISQPKKVRLPQN